MEAARKLTSHREFEQRRSLSLIEGDKRGTSSKKVISLLFAIICISILFNVIQRTSFIENDMTEGNLIRTLQEEKLYKKKLMAEIAQLKSSERIEEIAVNKLGMITPSEVKYVRLTSDDSSPKELAMKSGDKPNIR
ncbi:MAG: hypothetical protein QMD53_01335 [Actinomycetota bacterium]|nr:hypothetical protein [Actinomycetota bacterium]